MFSAKLCLYFEVCKGLEIRGVGGRPSDWGRNNNLGLSTYRDEAMSGKSDLSSPEIVHSWEANPNNYERRKK